MDGWGPGIGDSTWMLSLMKSFGQVPSTGIVDSNYGNGEVKQVGLIS